ncbi:MAG: DMT family transporter [Actinobacteria bacterium]|nr:DMT family transporter [Actinomycetota bacterium]
MDHQVRNGRAAATFAVSLMAFGPIIVKISDLASLRFVFWRLAAALVVYLAYLVASGSRLTIAALRTSFWGGLLFGLNMVLFVTFMRRTSATHAVVMGSLQPIVLLGVAGPLFGERPRRSLYLWSLLAIGGVVLSLQGGDPSGVATVEGDVMAFFGMLLWCGYYVVSKRARLTVDSTVYQLCLTLVATIIILPAALVSGHGVAPPSGAEWWPILLMAAIPGTGHLLTNYAHAHVTLTVMGLINLLFTVITPLYAWWLVDEALGGVQALGIVVVVVTLAMVVTRPTERPAGVPGYPS